MEKDDTKGQDSYAELWDAYVAAWRVMQQRIGAMYKIRHEVGFQELVRSRVSPRFNGAIFEFLEEMDPTELSKYADVLLDGATHFHEWVYKSERLLWSLPEEWLRENIKALSIPILADIGDIEQYAHMLRIFDEVDHTLAMDLAREMLSHSDEEIRECGEEYLWIREKEVA